MASPHIIDIDELLQPISADSPQGSDIREDSSPTSLYYQIKDARNAARAAERASLFDPDEASNVLNEWRPILDLAPTILKENSKDLEVASWLLEAARLVSPVTSSTPARECTLLPEMFSTRRLGRIPRISRLQ